MASLVYTERIPESKRIGGWFNALFKAGILTDALVAANATNAALKTAVDTATVKTEQRPMVTVFKKAFDRGVSLGQIPTPNHGTATVAALVALTDSNTTFKQGFYS
jgi:alkaline phosphatase